MTASDTATPLATSTAISTVTASATTIPASSILITNPLSDQGYSGLITVRAVATSVSRVSYQVDQFAVVGMRFVSTTASWEADLDTRAMVDGNHHVTVIGQGLDGTMVQDRAWNIRVSNSVPSATATLLVFSNNASPIPTGTASATTAGSKWFGVNQAGAEFGESALPGTRGVDYIYPASASNYSYFAGKGQSLIRMPFLWERVQPTAYGPLSEQDVFEIQKVLDVAAANHQRVILDLHNYGRYYNTTLTPAESTKLADVWRKLASRFHGHPGLYGYELMNEPHDLGMSGEQWRQVMQTTTSAIREVDNSAYVLIPGTSWQSARYWRDNNEGLIVQDPAARLLYAAHQYCDANYTGTYQAGYDATSSSECAQRLLPFLDWLAAKNVQGIITEYGVPDNDTRWLDVLDRFMGVLESNSRIAGGTYWAGGPWWGSYALSVEPRNGQDRPQMSVLSRYSTRP
jgi:endoglucanase